MKIYFATDHAGFELKEKLLAYVRGELGHDVEDVGAYAYDEIDDYPDFVAEAARAIAKDPENARGIILGGSGQGEAMVANRFAGVRAVVWYGGDESMDIVRLSREHNNANVLSIGGRFVSEQDAKEVVRLWLTTEFSEEERHIRRIRKVDTAVHT